MLRALVTDLSSIGCHQIVTTADSRFPPALPSAVDVVTLPHAPNKRCSALPRANPHCPGALPRLHSAAYRSGE